MQTNDLTVVVSHTEDHAFLYHCLDILEVLGFERDKIWVDGFRSYCENLLGNVGRVTTHNEQHGARCFDILNEAPTEYVIILDSDFFCTDKNFWTDALNKVKEFPIVSLEKSWCSLPMLTTPFVAYQREQALKMAPVRAAWNHFAIAFPGMPNPLFDHLMYIFFIAMTSGKTFSLDVWEGQRKYQFCHLWDSRHNYRTNFDDFKNLDISSEIRYRYLAYGISKYFFHYVAGNIAQINPRIWDLCVLVKINKEFYHEIESTVNYLGNQISFKPEWLKRFEIVTQDFKTKVGAV